MSGLISGNMVGSYSQLGKTFVLVDENGTELTGVVVDQETIFTATDSTVASGFVYAGDSGVSIGTREFLAYRTTCELYTIFPGEDFSIPLPYYEKYNYTKLQCIISKYNTTLESSVFTDKIVIDDCVYDVNSIDILSNITKNSITKAIDLNITNNTEDIYIIRYFTYKQEEI